MATAQVDIPSSERIEEGSFQLPVAEFPEPTSSSDQNDLKQIVADWASRFNQTLKSGDWKQFSNLIWDQPSGYWRDHLGLSWDFRCLKGSSAVISFFEANKSTSRINEIQPDSSSPLRCPAAAPVDGKGQVMGVQSFITFTSEVGSGRGIVRLLPDQQGQWKAYTIYTKLEELSGHEEKTASRRPLGVEHGTDLSRENWQDKRSRQENFVDVPDPVVLIVGCGHSGLMSAARLKQVGVEALIIDRHERVGDNWRKRYHQLVLHDPVWYDHLPYLPFPPNWPVFSPKDKLADWFETYVNAMELNVWLKTSLVSADWDSETKSFVVQLKRIKNGVEETRTIKPRHIIQATGHSGEIKFPNNIQGLDQFKGDKLVHSSQHIGASKNSKGKNAIVVGCCNSGHDIAQDYYENGYNVTMVQRSTTSIITSNTVLEVLLKPLYSEDGPPTDDSDLIFASIPTPVLKSMHQDLTIAVNEREAELRKGLTAAGFKLDNGPDESGFFMKYFARGGGYYIDVGASQLIVDGKIKIKQGQEIASVNEHSITFADGEELPADEIVFATGYQNMKGTARRIFGDAIADKLKDVWGFDEEGEIRAMWRPSGHEGFWFFGGNLALCRYYSKLVALQIKATEVGLVKP